MSLDAAIGDDQQLAIVGDGHVVGADAARVELCDAAEFVSRVVDADHAAIAVEIVLAGIKPRPVRREMAVPVEMPAFRGGDHHRFRLPRRIEHHGKRAGTAGEGDGAAGGGAIGHAVGAGRKGDAVDDLAAFRNGGDAERAVRRAKT
jgi:hypothetical protein